MHGLVTPSGSALASVIFILLAFAGARPAAAQQAPADELQHLRASGAVTVELFAAEPLLTNPSAIDVDTQGRVWVAEIQHYRAAAKIPPADKIKVLEDADGDGRADRSTVFAEGLFCPMSICVAGAKVYVATSPDLWIFEDRDGDLKADGPPTRLLSGFGGYNHDHGAHSLVLGPDHCWWMSHGDGGFDVRGTDGSHVDYRWGAVLRGELDGGKLQIVARNFRNPYEVCISSFGEAYLSDNDNDGNQSARVCWILEGGNYGWFGHPPARPMPGTPYQEHWHFRGHVPGFVPATLVTGFGSPCGICYYEGDAFEQFKNAVIHADAGPREVRVYRHQPRGAGKRATSQVLLTSEGDDYFRPDDVCVAPDGSIYVADWYDGGVGGHAYNNPHQGRIFRLTPKGKRLARKEKPGPYQVVADAIVGLASPNLATQFLARERLLAAPAEALPQLKRLLATEDANVRGRALWLLDRMGDAGQSIVLGELKSADDRFRALAVRILRRHGGQYGERLLGLVEDPSAEVRREVLLAASVIDSAEARQVVINQAMAFRGGDRYLAEVISIAAGDHKTQLFETIAMSGTILERFDLLAALDPDATVGLLAREIQKRHWEPELARQALLRLGALPGMAAARATWKIAIDQAAERNLRRECLAIVAHNLPAEWNRLTAEPVFRKGLRVLLGEAEFQPAALRMIAVGDLSAFGDDVLVILQSPDSSAEARAAAIEAVSRLRLSAAAPTLTAIVVERADLREAAIKGLIELASWPQLRGLLTESDVPPEIADQVLGTMMQTTGGAIAVLRLIDEHQLTAARQQRAIDLAVIHPDANIRTLFDRFVAPSNRPQRLGEVIDAEAILMLQGNRDRGREVFARSSAAQCSKCHVIDRKGGSLGPDLSQIGKKYERRALLETILAPSKAIAPEYVPYLAETKGGQLSVGFLVTRNDREIVLRDAENRLIRIAAGDIDTLEPQQKSLMPELVLQELTAQDAADLLAYLESLR